MDFKSLVIGFLLAALMFVTMGAGTFSTGRYQMLIDNQGDFLIADTHEGVIKEMLPQGDNIRTYSFKQNSITRINNVVKGK